MRRERERGAISDALRMAQDEVFEMQDSMNTSAENMPEQLNHVHARAAARLDVALMFLYRCEPPSELKDEEVSWTEWTGKIFRPQRRDNAVSFLRAYRGRLPEIGEMEELRKELTNAIEVLEGVFFPGMSGRRAA